MRIGSVGFGSAVLFSLLSAGSATAQRVSADIRIGGRGPVSGHVRIESRDRNRDRDRYSRDYGYRPRQVRVEVFRRNDRGRHLGWYKQMQRRGRVVVVYYDRDEDCYYDRRFYPGLQEIRVYEQDGRYYRSDDDRYDDRYDRRDGRYDGRDGRYDGRDGRDGRGGRDGWDERDRRDGRDN